MLKICESNNSVSRALSLLKAFGNVVFISESQEQSRRLTDELLIHLKESAITPKIIELNPVISSNTITLLNEAIAKQSTPVIGFTNMEGFRQLETISNLAGRLQFILAERYSPGTKRDKSVLIIGATSLFGSAVYQLFSQEYKFVRGTGFTKANLLGFDKLDVSSAEEIKEYFSKGNSFDIVIYIAGEANADVAEKQRDRAWALNVDAVANISRYVKNCKFVYISSEYIFDGNAGPYGSGSKAQPINYYGQTKLEGERVCLENFSDALILRLGALYGYNGPSDKETSVSKIIDSLDKAEALQLDNVQVKHPILLEDAANTLLKLLDYEVSGIYQTNGPEGLNKQEMAQVIAAVRSEVTGHIFSYLIGGAQQGSTAGKPLDTHMVNVDTPRLFNEGIRFMFFKKNGTLKKG